ncbi:MAG: transglutaminase domain-containing protein, partial [Oceanospirillaceae bacterium]|nr:transglutaminase domain-containing protein [Oceanospirillaceae bacterium]
NFVVVKQEHAHVWVEIWTDAKGWQRVDAKDFVAPPEPEQRLAQSPTAVKAKPQKEAQTPSSSAVSSSTQAPLNTKKPADSQTNKDRSSDKGWLSQLNLGFETWMLNYNPDRQIELMKKGGLRHVDWKNLAALAVLGLILLALIYGLLLQIGQQKQDPVRRSFERLNKQMRKRQLECNEQECPSQWLQRIAVSPPTFYPALEQIVGQYMTLRYATNTELQPKRLQQFQRDVKRLIAML